MPGPATRDGLAPTLPRVLVVDDDPLILCLLQQKLESAGFVVAAASSAQLALDAIARHGLPHLAIVDIMMPGMDGLAFCRTVQQFADLPVIMLTAVDDKATVIASLEQFAEDYIVKPFSPGELVARVKRVLRRIDSYGYALQPVTQIDAYLALDFGHQQAIVGGRAVPLTPTENKILHILMRNAGHIVSADFLLRRLWPLEEVFEDTLRVHIHRLRAKIEPEPARPRYVITERGIGYRFPLPAQAGMAVR